MLNKTAQIIDRAGVSANTLSVCGFLLGLAGAVLIAVGSFFQAGVCIGFSGLCDLLDGKVARIRKCDGHFGALLDSTLDRYTDAVLYSAAAFFYIGGGYTGCFVLALSALAGSFQVSYVRARSEGLSLTCRVGFWERGERMIVFLLGLLTGNLPLSLVYLGIFTHGTALRRLAHGYFGMKAGSSEGRSRAGLAGFFLKATPRRSAAFRWIASAVIGTIVLFRVDPF